VIGEAMYNGLVIVILGVSILNWLGYDFQWVVKKVRKLRKRYAENKKT